MRGYSRIIGLVGMGREGGEEEKTKLRQIATIKIVICSQTASQTK